MINQVSKMFSIFHVFKAQSLKNFTDFPEVIRSNEIIISHLINNVESLETIIRHS